VASSVFHKIPEMLTPGMPEFELAAEIQREARLAGHQGAFRVRKWTATALIDAIASGTSACMPTFFDGPVGGQGVSAAMPVGSGAKAIATGEPVIVDLVIALDGYHVDTTRVFALGGLDRKLREAHQLAVAILKELESMLKPEVNACDLYEKALSMASDSPFADCFMGIPGENVSFVGHGIGLEVDEIPALSPRSKAKLAASNVLAIEPKFFLKDLGGVGVENTYIVGEDGPESLTPFSCEIVVV